MYDWRTILRPVWGFVALQPVILVWFYLFSDDWMSDYTALGWPLQIVSTVWLIPGYAVYERWWDRRLPPANEQGNL
jgi:hypothetical protein